MTVQEYMQLPYGVVIRHINDTSGAYYYATVLELDGCQSDGATVEEAYKNVREAMEIWIKTKLEAGHPIPEPVDEAEKKHPSIQELFAGFTGEYEPQNIDWN